MKEPCITLTTERINNMQIDLNRDGEKLTAVMHGRIDTVSAPEAEEILLNALDGVTDLVLDFEDIQYISSAGLRVLLLAYKKMVPAGTMKLIHVSDVVKDILEITGFLELLNVQDE